MILDNENQKQNLLQCVRNVRVEGIMAEAIQIVNMLKGLEHDLETAQVGPSAPSLNIVEVGKDGKAEEEG